jgi:hypothetical protein
MKKVKFLVIILVLIAILLPIYIGSNGCINNYLNQTNAANNINGIATPILYLLTSILLYLSFREQYLANQSENKNEKRDRLIREIDWLEIFMEKEAKEKNSSRKSITLNLFCDYINKVNHQGEEKDYLENPEMHLREKHFELSFLLTEFERIYNSLIQIEDSNLKKEMSLRLYRVFQIYFHEALTIGLFRSKFKKENKQDYIDSIHKNLLFWQNSLKEKCLN